MSTKPAAKQTAHEAYEHKRAVILQQIVVLQGQLDRHAGLEKSFPANWGFAGDLDHVKAKLDEVLEFLR